MAIETVRTIGRAWVLAVLGCFVLYGLFGPGRQVDTPKSKPLASPSDVAVTEAAATPIVEASTKPPSSPPDRSRMISDDSYFGCVDWDLYKKLGSFVAQGDKVAWRRVLTNALATGECKRWEKGERVYRQETGFASHCLRPEGEEQCYWTPREAIN